MAKINEYLSHNHVFMKHNVYQKFKDGQLKKPSVMSQEIQIAVTVQMQP